MIIKAQFADELGIECDVLLFGSRTSDLGRGGDVDFLFVRTREPIARKVWAAARLAARAERLLDGRKVDVVLLDPNTVMQPIHAAALATGVAMEHEYVRDATELAEALNEGHAMVPLLLDFATKVTAHCGQRGLQAG